MKSLNHRRFITRMLRFDLENVSAAAGCDLLTAQVSLVPRSWNSRLQCDAIQVVMPYKPTLVMLYKPTLAGHTKSLQPYQPREQRDIAQVVIQTDLGFTAQMRERHLIRGPIFHHSSAPGAHHPSLSPMPPCPTNPMPYAPHHPDSQTTPFFPF